jgi:hypothetical protein
VEEHLGYRGYNVKIIREKVLLECETVRNRTKRNRTLEEISHSDLLILKVCTLEQPQAYISMQVLTLPQPCFLSPPHVLEVTPGTNSAPFVPDSPFQTPNYHVANHAPLPKYSVLSQVPAVCVSDAFGATRAHGCDRCR